MRISNEQVQQILAAQSAKGVSKPSKVEKSAGADAVSMSSLSQELQKAQQVLAGLPEIRTDLVADLKARIEAGTYQVSSRDVAESLIRRAAYRLL